MIYTLFSFKFLAFYKAGSGLFKFQNLIKEIIDVIHIKLLFEVSVGKLKEKVKIKNLLEFQ